MIGTTDKVIRQKGAYFRVMEIKAIKYSNKSIKTQKWAYFGDFREFEGWVLTKKINMSMMEKRRK